MAGTDLYPDAPFDPKSERNIFITLKESEIGLSNTITMSKELLEANIFIYLPRKDVTGLIQNNEPILLDVFDYDTKITTTHIIRKDGDNDFKFHGWNMVLQGKHFRTGDTIVFWWDIFHIRLNFKQFMFSFNHLAATDIRGSAARPVVESALTAEALAVSEALKPVSMAAIGSLDRNGRPASDRSYFP
ncbi:hypothetical protein IGI04_020524 [Brassica rapa subsp. trilocularis]|uniref:TF-B3 domain-containing protein n=1 Tax=Brassica rapa subsp. trilocularis TaxID=1813537 RepID=A0ABQ7MLD6_BRACM|nr:hypothetical protein IGI04_020524 [Brassica rapa subsp. trilocularis]